MMDSSALKKEAAERAVAGLKDGMAIGLGTGSTAYFMVEAIAQRIRDGSLRGVVGVPTSERTAAQARGLGIPLTTLESHPVLDVTIDGADEVSPDLDLVKGLGGALLREKIVASAARRLVIVVDESKLVKKLGIRAPLPVEVVPFGWEVLPPKLKALGADPVLRRTDAGEIFVTDGGHFILDCMWAGGIPDARDMQGKIKSMVGVVDTGLFIGMASEILVAEFGGVRTMARR